MSVFKIRIHTIILVGLAYICAVSCSTKENNQYDEQNTPQMLSLQTNIQATYSVDMQHFLPTDCIGVYLVDYAKGQPGVLGDIANSSKNIKYTLQESSWIADAGREIYLYSDLSDVYAYYPYDLEMGGVSGKRNLAAYPFSVKSDQRTAGAENDFLWAKAAGLSNINNRANLTFEHVLSKLVVNLHHNDKITDDLNFRIHNIQTSGTINLRNGDASATDGKQTIYPGKNPTVENGFNYKYEAILFPQTIKAGTMLFSIKVNGNTLVYITQQELELMPQKSYTFNMSVGEVKRNALPSIQMLNIETKSFE